MNQKISNLQPVVGGKVEVLNSSVLLLIAVFNITKFILTEESILFLWAYWAPFIFFAVIFLVVKNKYLTSFFYLFIAVGVTLTTENASDFSGAIFFLFAFHQLRSMWSLITGGILTIVAIVTRSITVGDTIPGNAIMLLVFAFVYGIYWLTIYQPLSMEGFPALSKEENELLRLMSTGLSQKQAGGVLGCDQSQTSNMVKKIRKKVGAESLLEVMFCYGSINSNKK